MRGSYYLIGATASPKQYNSGAITVYRTGVDYQPTVGLESSGYFRNELDGLNGEVMQFDRVLGEFLGLRRTGTLQPKAATEDWWDGQAPTESSAPVFEPKDVTPVQLAFVESVWRPFLVTWKQFYEKNPTLRKIVPVVMQSRLTQLEGFRDRFIKLRAEADRLFKGEPLIASLPAPTPVKKYQSFWEDIKDDLKGGVKWVFIVLAGLVVLFLVVTRFGGPAVPAIAGRVA